MFWKTRLALLPLALCVAPRADAQGSVRTLSKPDAEYAEPFTNVSGIRELRDGRVLVADIREKTVQLIDFKAGSATRVGREGSGPGEYSLPMVLTPLPGDSSVLFDPGNQRYLLITPDGKPGSTFTIDAPTGASGGGGRVLAIRGPSGIDAQGRLYFQGSPFTFGPDGPKSADSAAIYRYDRSTKKTDTLGFLKLPPNNAQISGGGNSMRVMIGNSDPFEASDAWVVAPDGRVAIARAADYRVDWLMGKGRRVSGPPVKYDRIKVTEADKKEWRDARAKAPTMQISQRGGGGGTQTNVSAGAPSNLNIPDPSNWSEYKPAFLRGTSAVVAAPNGEVWVLRSRPAGDQVPTYDVFDGQGRLTGKVILPKRTRLAGFGNGTVYLVRSDEDDLQYLQRYKLS